MVGRTRSSPTRGVIDGINGSLMFAHSIVLCYRGDIEGVLGVVEERSPAPQCVCIVYKQSDGLSILVESHAIKLAMQALTAGPHEA